MIENNQSAKADSGKAKLTLVPRRVIFDIAKVREYGTEKYGDPDNWRKVDVGRYRDAAFRHFLAYLDDPQGVDEESGLPHYWHLACNIAFICEIEDAIKEVEPFRKYFQNQHGFSFSVTEETSPGVWEERIHTY